MADASVALQQAIFDVASGLGWPVHDRVPPGEAFPFIVIGDDSSVEDGEKNKDGQRFTTQISAYSRYRGRKEVKEMNAAIRGAFHLQPLAVAGFNHVQTECEMQDVLADPEPDTWHGVNRLAIIIEDS